MHVELVRTVTRDGLRLDGALAPAASESLLRTTGATAALLLHGVAGNFYTSSTFELLIPRLQTLGIAALLVNTRGHDSVYGASTGNMRRRLGAAYETVDDCRFDVAAWIEFLKRRGHERIVLIGHSLGAIKVVYAQAHEKFAEVAGVIAVSGPRLSYATFMNAPESSLFWESMHLAQQMAKVGQEGELFTSKYPFPLLITAASYIDKYGPAERYNLLKFAADLLLPALFTYGSKELANGGVAFAGVPEALKLLPNAERREVAIIDGADHVYTGTAERLADVICQWIGKSGAVG